MPDGPNIEKGKYQIHNDSFTSRIRSKSGIELYFNDLTPRQRTINEQFLKVFDNFPKGSSKAVVPRARKGKDKDVGKALSK